MPFTLRPRYLLLAILLFITEVVIALYVHDSIIRPYIGDFLVVMLIYCFMRAFFRVGITAACIGVLIFSYLIELSQYFHLASHPIFHHFRLARIVLGNSFEWMDIGMYTAGIITVFALEYFAKNKMAKSN